MKLYTNTILPLLRLIAPDDRKKALGIIVLMIFNAILDFFSLASFLPLIFLLVNPAFISSNQYINKLYEAFNFSSQANFIITLTVGVLLLTLFKTTLNHWITKAKANFSFSLGSSLSSRMLSRYLEIDYLKFTQTDFTRELNRIANLPIAFANNIFMPLANLVTEGLVFLTLLLCIAMYDPGIFLLIIAILAPVGLLYRVQRKQMKKNSQEIKEKYPLSLKSAMQVVEGLVDIKASGKESFFKIKFDQISQRLADAFARDHASQSGATRLTEVIAVLITCLIIIYSVAIGQGYQQKLLLLGIYAGASFRMIPSINRILNSILQIKSHEYLFKELDITGIEAIDAYEPSIPLKFDKSIEIIGVSFQYPNGANVLQNASLVINKGEKIALVGKSGTGKTTLLLILLQFLKEQSGQILLDGVGHDRKYQKAWRKIFGYVPQNPYLLDGTIAENIAFGLIPEQIDTTKIEQLIVELDLEQMISQLPDGLATLVGEKGIKLSGGQRQRIAIARVLYADAEVLLFDEITNQLDTTSEQEILHTLEKASLRNKTMVMITHHAHLLNRFDRIVRLENGVLTDESTSKSTNW